MFVITITKGGNSTVIHEPGTSAVKVDAAKISREVNMFDSLEFDISPNNPGYPIVEEFATLVTVQNLKTGKTAFDGRIIKVVPKMDSDGIVCKSVTCESVMGYLCDSTQLYEEQKNYADSGSTSGLKIYLDKLLTLHNSRVEEHKRINLGEITLQTFDTSGGVTKGIDRASTWDNINDKLLNVFGGEMRVRRASDGLLYLDYAENLGTTRATPISVGWNMADAESSPDPDGVITRLYPYGAKITVEEEDENGNTTERETEERIGIESVNGGVPYIDDAVAIGKYGIIEGYQEWDDVTQPANLLTKAQEWLGDNNALPVSHTFTAYDLSLLGLDADAFEIFDKYPCLNPLIGLDETLEIVKQTIDINDPENSTFDMGDSAARLSSDLAGTATKGDVQLVQSQINTSITNVNNRVTTTQAALEVADDRITQTVMENVQQSITEEVDQATAGINAQLQQAITTANDAATAADTAAGQAAQAIGIANGKADVFIQSTEPGTAYRKGTTLWIDTTDGANTPKRWDGSAWVAVTDKQAIDAANAAAEAAQAAQDAQDYADDLAEGLDSVSQTVTTNTQRVTNLEQTVDGWSFEFNTITEEITNLGNQVSTEYTERLKYIKFIDGEIWLGRDPDPGQDDFKVVISNERIRFLQNNIEVAYLSNDRLFIRDAQILANLMIGNFAWLPRSNGGMSLRHNS